MKKPHADYADDADKKDKGLSQITQITQIKKTGRLMSSSTKKRIGMG
ncbi:MAG TPA: hypothetical protein PLE33_02020 [Candidatus Cloacimonas sp.]|nr:hypothetical protein [Candidatus Cloacimonas sp.]